MTDNTPPTEGGQNGPPRDDRYYGPFGPPPDAPYAPGPGFEASTPHWGPAALPPAQIGRAHV